MQNQSSLFLYPLVASAHNICEQLRDRSSLTRDVGPELFLNEFCENVSCFFLPEDFTECIEDPIEKVKLHCRQWITLVKPISREISSEVGGMISFT